MRTLYVDYDFKVYTTNAEGRMAIETDVFDGISDYVVECYRFVPSGSSYTKPNGLTVHGEFIQPFVTENELYIAQREYEQKRISELEIENTTLLEGMAQSQQTIDEYEQALTEIEKALGVTSK